MWILAIFLLQVTTSPCASIQPVRTDPPTLIVQAVDPGWLPLPGIEVTLQPKKGKPETARTSSEGQARFWVPQDAEYSVELKYPGFKTVRIKKVHLGTSTPFSTAYVQAQLHIAGPFVTVW